MIKKISLAMLIGLIGVIVVLLNWLAFKDLNAQRYFPVHWGMFELALHTWFDPVEQLTTYASQDGFELVTPKLGELVHVKQDNDFRAWWSSGSEHAYSKDESVNNELQIIAE